MNPLSVIEVVAGVGAICFVAGVVLGSRVTKELHAVVAEAKAVILDAKASALRIETAVKHALESGIVKVETAANDVKKVL